MARIDEPREPMPPLASSQLSLWDAVNLVIGIVVGTAIFRSTTGVFENSSTPGMALVAWLLGGVLSLIGALCYAELGTTYERTGGDYIYLTRAYGRWAGFLFGWAQLTAVLTSSIGTMAYTFADYAGQLGGFSPGAGVWIAAASVVGLSLANAWDAKLGKRTQNLLTAVKVLGLGCVLAAGVACAARGEAGGSGPRAEPGAETRAAGNAPANFGLAMVFVLFAYGGWNDSAFVAAEVEDRKRNVPRALLGGLAAITVLYLAMNVAYLAALGFEHARRTSTPAADVMQAATGAGGAKFVSALVMISALGAINGMILTGSRLYAALGADHRILSWLGRCGPGDGVPRSALAAQGAVTLAMIFAVGTAAGRSSIDRIVTAAGAPAIPWERYFGGFETLVASTAPLFWALLFATGTAMMALRWQEPNRERPFAVPWYPLPPLVFCATCAYMFWSSLQYAGWLTVLGLIPAAAGVMVYAVGRKRDEARESL